MVQSGEKWVDVCRPGYLGRHKREKYAQWDAKYGKGNWRLVWKADGKLLDFVGTCAMYEDAYFNFLKRNPKIIKTLINDASDVYDDSPTNIQSCFDYKVQETNRTHVQDIAIRRSVRRLGLAFRGKRPIRIRASIGKHPLSRLLSPGKVPFHRPELIIKPEVRGSWWDASSTEAFYQSNKFLQSRLTKKTPYLIGVAGPSCSGKSTLCESVAEKYKEVAHLKLDDFFKNTEEFPMFSKWRNWELPGNLKLEELHAALVKLKNGKEATVPVYAKRIGKYIGNRTVKPNKILIVEGFLLFYPKKIRELFDLKLFLDVPEKVQLSRRIRRQSDFDVEYFYKVTTPMYKKYGGDAVKHADYVIDANRTPDNVKEEFERILAEHIYT